MISERTLKRWRKEALALNQRTSQSESSEITKAAKIITDELNERILKLTQELMDQHLLRKRG